MQVAIVLNILDFITGTLAALRHHDIQSSRMRDGLFKKFGFVVLYVLGWAWEKWGAGIGLPMGHTVLTAVCVYVCSIEVVSLLENINKLNPQIIPEKIMSLLKITNKGDGGEK